MVYSLMYSSNHSTVMHNTKLLLKSDKAFYEVDEVRRGHPKNFYHGDLAALLIQWRQRLQHSEDAMRQGQSLNLLSLSLLWGLRGSYQHITSYTIYPIFPQCALSQNQTHAAVLIGDENHWEKGELDLTYAPCMDTYTNTNSYPSRGTIDNLPGVRCWYTSVASPSTKSSRQRIWGYRIKLHCRSSWKV